LHHHIVLSSEPLVAHSSALLVVVWHINFPAIQLRYRRHARSASTRLLVPSAEGLLLCNSGPWLPNYSLTGVRSHDPTNSLSHAATHAAGYSTCDTASDAAPDSASRTHSGTRTC